jgi:hypothetical protein
MGHTLFNAAVKRTHNFEQMLVEFFGIRCCLRHKNLLKYSDDLSAGPELLDPYREELDLPR